MFFKKPTQAEPTAIDNETGKTIPWAEMMLKTHAEYHKSLLESRAAEAEHAAQLATTDLRRWAVEQAIKAGSGYEAVELATEIEHYVTGADRPSRPDQFKQSDFPTAEEMRQQLSAIAQQILGAKNADSSGNGS